MRAGGSWRAVVAVLALAGLGALAWQQRGWLGAHLGGSPGAAHSPAADATAPGGLRKCVKGAQVSYTNVACPPGSRAQPVAAAPVTVVPATPVPRAVAAASAGSGPAALREMLDMRREESLHDRAVERAVNGGR